MDFGYSKTNKISCLCFVVCLENMHLKITQTFLTNTPFKGQTPVVFGVIGSQCDCNLAENPEKRSARPVSYTVYGQVRGCLCLVQQISAWTDGVMLNSLQNCVDTY